MQYTKDYQEAIKCFDKSIEINPSNSELWYQKAKALVFLKKYDEAVSCLERAADINPGHIDALALMASVMIDAGRFDDAIEKCDKILEINKRNKLRNEVMFGTYDNKAWALLSLNRFNDALRYYDRALDLNPNKARTWYGKGLVYMETKNYQEAIICFDKSIEINPGNKGWWISKAAAFFFMKKYDEAIKCARESGDREYIALALYGKGVELDQSKMYASSLEYYKQAIEIKANDAVLWLNRGVCLYYLERYEEALESYDIALGIRPNDPDNTIKFMAFDNNYDKDKWLEQLLWHNKGDCLNMLGRYGESGLCFDKAVYIGKDLINGK